MTILFDILNDDYEAVREKLEVDAEIINDIHLPSGMDMAMIAAWNGSERCITEILTHADLLDLKRTDNRGHSLLEIAFFGNNPVITAQVANTYEWLRPEVFGWPDGKPTLEQ